MADGVRPLSSLLSSAHEALLSTGNASEGSQASFLASWAARASPAATTDVHVHAQVQALSAAAQSIAMAEAALWLQAVARAACALLAHEYLRIPRLESGGVRQLVADYEHLTSVLAALQVGPDPLLQWLVAIYRFPAAQLPRFKAKHLASLATMAGMAADRTSATATAKDDALQSLFKSCVRARGGMLPL